MKKLIKKSILNGLIRTIVSLLYSVFVKVKTYKNVEINGTSNEFIVNNNVNSHNNNSNNNCKNSFNPPNQTDNKSSSSCYPASLSSCKLNNNEHKFDQTKNKKLNPNPSDEKKNNLCYHEYRNESGKIIKLASSSIEQSSSSSSFKTTNPANPNKKVFKIRAVLICICVIIAYVSLNNYLIIFVYYQSSSSVSSSASSASSSHSVLSEGSSLIKTEVSSFTSFFLNFKPIASFFHMNINKKRILNSDYESEDSDYDSRAPNWSKLKIMIDPQDLEVAGLTIRSSNKIVLLNESYFDEDEASLDNQTGDTSQTKDKFAGNLNKHPKIFKLHDYHDKTNNKMLNNVSTSTMSPKQKYRRPCVLPKLNPYDREIMQFVKKEEELKCNPKKNWIYIENGKKLYKLQLCKYLVQIF